MSRFQTARHLFATVLLAIVCTATTPNAHASLITYDNLGSSPYHTYGYATFGHVFGDVAQRAMQFTASKYLVLTTLELALGQASPHQAGASPGQAKVQLMTDVDGQPGDVLETWTTSTLNTMTGQLEILESLNNPTLHHNQEYWVMLSAADGSNLGGSWYFAEQSQPGGVNTLVINSDGETYTTLTRGFRTRVSGVIRGDMNGDGQIDFDDINPLILALNDPTAYQDQYGVDPNIVGDMNRDGQLDFDDINAFITFLNTGETSVVPEPATISLIALASLTALARRRRRQI